MVIEFNKLLLDSIKKTNLATEILLGIVMIHQLKDILQFCVKFKLFAVET